MAVKTTSGSKHISKGSKPKPSKPPKPPKGTMKGC